MDRVAPSDFASFGHQYLGIGIFRRARLTACRTDNLLRVLNLLRSGLAGVLDNRSRNGVADLGGDAFNPLEAQLALLKHLAGKGRHGQAFGRNFEKGLKLRAEIRGQFVIHFEHPP